MKSRITIILICLFASAAFAASDADRWFTFKTGSDAGRPLEHQIDRQSIRQEGPYRTFWTRIWLVKDRQPFALSVNEAIVFWSQKFAVDCQGHRFASSFVDSTSPYEAKKSNTVQTARWGTLEKFPVVEKIVCGGK